MDFKNINIQKVHIKKREVFLNPYTQEGISTILYVQQDGKIDEKIIDHVMNGICENNDVAIATYKKDIVAYKLTKENDVVWSNQVAYKLNKSTYSKRTRFLLYAMLLIPMISFIILSISFFLSKNKYSNDGKDEKNKVHQINIISQTDKEMLLLFLLCLGILIPSMLCFTDLTGYEFTIFNNKIKSVWVLCTIHSIAAIFFIKTHNKIFNKYEKMKKETKSTIEKELIKVI